MYSLLAVVAEVEILILLLLKIERAVVVGVVFNNLQNP
jgi:hypothetical protein